MKYDFETMMDRRGRDSMAADKIPFEGAAVSPDFEPIPMWVADMSFPTAPPVLEAIEKRLSFPSFGYFPVSDEYYASIISWQERRNGIQGLLPEHIGYENGVLGGVSSAVQAFTNPGDKILLHSPCYVGFTHVLEDTGRFAVHSELKRDEKGIWRMDFEDMDRKIKENHIHFAIFCSPHNPSGRVWERWELEKAMEVYRENDCVVVSDEIWSDIILPGHSHIPSQSLSEDAKNRVIAFYAPSKSFSLAGLVGSYHIVYNKYLREQMERRSRMSHYNGCNVLSMHALTGAFSPEGELWLEEMCSVIDENCRYACDFIKENFPGVSAMQPQGTYMLFLDCGEYCRTHGITIRELQLRGISCGVIWQNGEDFFYPDSIRMNLALPTKKLKEAFDRLKKYAFI